MADDQGSSWLNRAIEEQADAHAAERAESAGALHAPAKRGEPGRQDTDAHVVWPENEPGPSPDALARADGLDFQLCSGVERARYSRLRRLTRDPALRRDMGRRVRCYFFLLNVRPEWVAVAQAVSEVLSGRPSAKPPPTSPLKIVFGTESDPPRPLPSARELAARAGLRGRHADRRARRILLHMASALGLVDGGTAEGWKAWDRACVGPPPQLPWRLFEVRRPSSGPDPLGAFESRGVPREHVAMLLARAGHGRPPFDGRSDGRESRLAAALAEELRRAAPNGRMPHHGWWLICATCQFVLDGTVVGMAWAVLDGHKPRDIERMAAGDDKLRRAAERTRRAASRLRKRAADTR